MSDEELAAADPGSALLAELNAAALQIYCARGGERIGSSEANKAYDQADALIDAAKLLTLSKNLEWMRQAIDHAAVTLGLPSIWPGSGGGG